MLGFIRKLFLAGLGVLALGVEKAKKSINKLAREGDISKKKIVKGLVETGESCSEKAKVIGRPKKPWWRTRIRIVRR